MHRNHLINQRYGNPAMRSTYKKTDPIVALIKPKTFEVPDLPKKTTIDAAMKIVPEPL